MYRFGFFLFIFCFQAKAEIHIAVATNFLMPMQEIKKKVEDTNKIKLIVSYASSGKLYNQIKNGAPFDVFLSADEQTPVRLEKEGLTVLGSRSTYATGSLVLWPTDSANSDQLKDFLSRTSFRKIAIAHPIQAPYGRAAVEVLKKLGIYSELKTKLVQGENIGQTYQFVQSKNASVGFLALSQFKKMKKGDYMQVPDSLHSPLRQQVVILKHGASSPEAKTFLELLKSKEIKDIILSYGYRVNK